MKYFIFRGCEGFGDRLQCLSQAIQYCFISGRILVIDWRDHHWTQGKYHSIYEYLTIKKIKTIDIKNFIENHYHEKLSIFNEKWKDKISKENTMRYMYEKDLRLPDQNKILQKIIKQEVEDFEEDIVVYNGVSFRVWDKKFLNFINFSRKVYDLVEEVYQKTNIKKKNISAFILGQLVRAGNRIKISIKNYLIECMKSFQIKINILSTFTTR